MKALLLVLILALLPQAAVAGRVSGRVVADDRPLAGLRVGAYRDLLPNSKPLANTLSDADGLYHFNLPAGRYAFFAADRDHRLFAFSGRNPVIVGKDDLWLGLQAVPVSAAVVSDYDDEYSAALEGRVLFAGRPLAGAIVYLYLDTAEGLKGQGYRMSPPTGADGSFFFDNLPESSYFVLVRQRQNGQQVGPVLAGDRIGFYPGNPVVLRAGKALKIELATVEKQHSAAASETLLSAGATRISGRVVDAAGQPAAGVHVFAYTNRVIGHQRPAALSSPTGADGRFQVFLPTGGTYYLGAREFYGDSPAPGERFGLYQETADHGLTVATGERVDKLRIVVEPIRLE